MSDLDRAITLATRAHAGQTDKGDQPYILHPLRVMLQVSEPHERMTAVLHDVVEDTEVSLEDLSEQGFPLEVIEAIDALTKRDGETRLQAAKRAAANPIARMVKIADVSDNLDTRRLKEVTSEDERRLKEYREVLSYLKSCAPMPILPPIEKRTLVETAADAPTYTSIIVEIMNDGVLRFSGHDMGEAPERFFGDDEYEYWLVVEAIDKDRLLLALIDKLYSGNLSLISEFQSLLGSEGIPSNFWSYV